MEIMAGAMMLLLLLLLTILSYYHAAGNDASASPLPLSPRLPVWKSPQPDPDLPFGGYSVINTSRPELVFAATQKDGTYNHNVFLHYHPSADRLFAYWKNSVAEEDKPGQRVLLSFRKVEPDNKMKRWTDPVIAFGNLTTPGRETVMFGSPGVTLPNGHVYIAASPGYYNRSKTDVHVAQGPQCALWPDSLDVRNCGPAEPYAVQYHSTLLLRRVYSNLTLGPMFWAQQPPSLFVAATARFGIPSSKDMDKEVQEDVAALIEYRDDVYNDPCGLEFTGTTKCEWCKGGCQLFTDIDESLGITNERSTYTTNDGTDILLYRGRFGSPLLASTRTRKGTKKGENRGDQDSLEWSPPQFTTLPNDASNLNSGRLSNGLAYLVHNPLSRNGTDQHRDPLTLTTSWDGGWTWNDTGVVATCLRLPFGGCEPRFVHEVNSGPSYPQLIEVVGTGEASESENVGVWVGFSNNKEDVWVVKVLKASLSPEDSRNFA